MSKYRSPYTTKIVEIEESPSYASKDNVPCSCPHGHLISNDEPFSHSASAQLLPRGDKKTKLSHFSPKKVNPVSTNAAIAAISSSTEDEHSSHHDSIHLHLLLLTNILAETPWTNGSREAVNSLLLLSLGASTSILKDIILLSLLLLLPRMRKQGQN
jgi:hypothetical protein